MSLNILLNKPRHSSHKHFLFLDILAPKNLQIGLRTLNNKLLQTVEITKQHALHFLNIHFSAHNIISVLVFYNKQELFYYLTVGMVLCLKLFKESFLVGY